MSTGKKVNSALDNPTNFFTAQSLDNRASDISNLLDGIGNGVQVLQAANTGITSLQKLVDTAKSIANQALQTTVGYSTKSNVSTTIAGATAADLRGTTTFTSATRASATCSITGAAGGTHAATRGLDPRRHRSAAVTRRRVLDDTAGTPSITARDQALRRAPPASDHRGYHDASPMATVSPSTANHHLQGGAAPAAADWLPAAPACSGNVVTDGNGNSIVYLGASATTLDRDGRRRADRDRSRQRRPDRRRSRRVRRPSRTNAGQTASSVTARRGHPAELDRCRPLASPARPTSSRRSVSPTATGARQRHGHRDPYDQRGHARHPDPGRFDAERRRQDHHLQERADAGGCHVATGSGVSGNVVTDGSGNSTVYLQSGTVADVLKAIDLATGVQTAAIASGAATLSDRGGPDQLVGQRQRRAEDLAPARRRPLHHRHRQRAVRRSASPAPPATTPASRAARTAGAGGINGKTLTFTSFNGGTAVNVTFGDGTDGTVKTLDQLNTALQANNLTATLDSTGKLTISATNDYASSTLGSATAGGAIGGTITSALTFSTASAPVVDAAAQTVRSNLVTQYNNILAQITTTAQDASFNGVNLLERRPAQADVQRDRQVDA